MSRRLILASAILLALIAVLKVTGVFMNLESGLRAATLPIARGASGIGKGIGELMQQAADVRVLEERVEEFKARLNTVVVDYVRLRSLEEENRELRALLHFEEESGYDFVPARIIGRGTNPRQVQLLIDKGARDGLEVGMALVAEEGIFVGKITELRERVSRVTLVSDEGSRIAAATAGRDQLIGLVEGLGNGTAELTLIPQQIELVPDDIIVTSGTEEKIPANLPIGLVNVIEGQPTDPFKRASIEPLLNVDQLGLLLVLRPTVLRPDS